MLTPELSSSLARIQQRLGHLENKSFQDNIMMASLQEEQDAEANRAMMDRITIMGVRIMNIRRLKEEERNEVMKNKVREVLVKLNIEDPQPELVYVKHLNRQARNPDNAVLEVKLKNKQQAESIRSAFIKMRDSPTVENLNITPVVRLATRVRIEILQAVSRLLKSKDSTVSKTQCLQFVPKPVLKVFRKDNRGNEFPKVMTFIDSIVWVVDNNYENQLDLKKAYQRAGANFKGVIAQHFVIMS
jgi:hypothetical protein